MIKVLKSLIESIDLSIYSYVKPAAPHRFSTHYMDLHSYVRTFTEALDYYMRAIRVGEDVASGRLGLDKVGLGDLILESLRASAKVLSFKNVPDIHLILMPVTVAASYARYLESSKGTFVSRFSRGLSDLMLYTSPEDVTKVYDALRSYGGRFTSIVEYLSLTRARIMSENMSLSDFYYELGNKDTVLRFFSRRHRDIVTYAQRFTDAYIKSGDYNLATINVYEELVKDIMNIRLDLKMHSRTDLLKLLRTDKELISRGTDLSSIIPLLTSSVFVGLLIMTYT